MNLLRPDHHMSYLKYYHMSSKLLIPSLFACVLSEKYDLPFASFFHSFGVLNTSFHSYVSLSTILTDYVKPRPLNTILRSGNIGIHFIATISYLTQINSFHF